MCDIFNLLEKEVLVNYFKTAMDKFMINFRFIKHGIIIVQITVLIWL